MKPKPKMEGHKFLFIRKGLAYFCELKGRPATVPCIKNIPKEQRSAESCQGCPQLARRTPYLEGDDE